MDRKREIAKLERFLNNPEDSIAWHAERPKAEAQLADLTRPPVRCTHCNKLWKGGLSDSFFNRKTGTCAGASACAERAKNARGRKQGARL